MMVGIRTIRLSVCCAVAVLWLLAVQGEAEGVTRQSEPQLPRRLVVAEADRFEPDDICPHASYQLVNGAPQIHGFHSSGDTDWVQFDVVGGQTYAIEAWLLADSVADVVFSLYSGCPTGVLPFVQAVGGTGVGMTFTANFTGRAYLELRNVGPLSLQDGQNADYELTIGAAAGRAVIVAANWDPLQNSINGAAGAMFDTLHNQGFVRSDILYLRGSSATKANLAQTLANLTATEVGTGRPLIVYIVANGNSGNLWLSSSLTETITPVELGSWLDSLNSRVPGVPVTAILESSQAGGFIAAPDTIAKANRVVIASTNSVQNAYVTPNGALFTNAFAAALTTTRDLADAFAIARQSVLSSTLYQQPWLDADGNTIANEPADFLAAAQQPFFPVPTLPTCHSVTLAHTGNGSDPVSTQPQSGACVSERFVARTIVRLSTQPAVGWHVAGWQGTDDDASRSLTNTLMMPAADHAVAVVYAPDCSPLRLSHTGSGLDPSPTPAQSPGCPAGQFAPGATITLTASPATGWRVAGWQGTADDAGTGTSISLQMPAADHAVTADYAPDCSPLHLSHTGSGLDPSPTPSQSPGCPAGQYAPGATTTLTASPAAGWRVAGWQGTADDASTGTTNRLLMPPAAHAAAVAYERIPAIGDAFEDDNTCERARNGEADGAAQRHTFHAAGDVDWVRVPIQSGKSYRIEVHTPQDSPADVDLELHMACGQLPTDQWSAPFTPGVRLNFAADYSGHLFLRLANYDSAVAGGQVAYDLVVYALPTAAGQRALILAAGRQRLNDRLQTNIHNVAGQVYSLFQQQGYQADDIYFLATDSRLTGYDAALTKETLRSAIVQWAAGRLPQGGVLNLYLVDHGRADLIFLDEANGQRVTAEELDGWLTSLETALPGIRINVFVEACQSGSFIDGSASLSKPGRVIVTSTSATADAWASPSGAYFSDHLLTWLRQGTNLFSSFFAAAQVAQGLYASQQAWLDANGNRIPNEPEDGAVAAQRAFAYANTLADEIWPPHIFSVNLASAIAHGEVTLRADVRDDVKVRQVWAVVYPPDYQPPTATGELQPETLPTFLLTPTGAEDRFAGIYPGFTQAGTYRVVVHAEDNLGMVARPMAIEVLAGGDLFMPLLRR